MTASALVLLDLLDDGRRGVVRDDDGRLTLATIDADDRATPLFVPTSIERLIVFADQAASSNPHAITHPKAIFFLATLALALVAMVDHASPEEET